MMATLSRSPIAALLADWPIPGGLVFTDLTLAGRAGVKGPGARAWLEGQGYGPLPRPNAAMRGASGVLVAMLGETEALLLRTADTPPLWSFEFGAALAPGAYPIPRGEGSFWITISGPAAPEMFACVCGVDLRQRSFANLQVAQTIVAKASAIIIRDDAVGACGFHLIGDISLGPYLVRQLRHAAQAG